MNRKTCMCAHIPRKILFQDKGRVLYRHSADENSKQNLHLCFELVYNESGR